MSNVLLNQPKSQFFSPSYRKLASCVSWEVAEVIDTLFFDSIDNKIYKWIVGEYDAILKIKREPNINPRNGILEYPYKK